MLKNAKLNILQLQAAVFTPGSYTSFDLQIIVKMSKNAKLNIFELQAAVFAPW